jgi:hypothetical protein
MHENIDMFFFMKTGYFNTRFVFLRYKVQANIKQNFITKYTGKSWIFPKIFFLKIFETGPDPT